MNRSTLKKAMRTALILNILTYSHTYGHTLDTTKVLEVSVSKQGFTRISVEGEVIKNVFCYPFDVEENVKLNKSGHLFIVGEGLKSPIHISVVTDRGVTQDLKLSVVNKPSEPIILKKESQAHDNIPEILANFAKGIQPEGFKPTAVHEEVRTQNNLHIKPIGAWLKKQIKITLYEVENTKAEAVMLTPELIRAAKDKSIVLTDVQLDPHQTTRFYTYQQL